MNAVYDIRRIFISRVAVAAPMKLILDSIIKFFALFRWKIVFINIVGEFGDFFIQYCFIFTIVPLSGF